MSTDFSLSFLDDLGEGFCDQDVEKAWRGRVFPLVCTDDFAANWSVVPDPSGLFITSSGVGCHIEPRLHHAPRCRVIIQHDDGTTRQETILYEAIVFAKVVYHLCLDRMSDDSRRPAQVARRHFVDQFVRKLPYRWRNLIIQCNLHHYEDHIVQRPRFIDLSVYVPLASPKNIRLTTLLPNRDSHAPIVCTLHEADLALGPEYEALSYVWGDPFSQHSILLNGRNFSVTENLEAALRHLRPRGNGPRTMWIDAICINQCDSQERADQVAQMDSIYRNASGVVIWLGRESNTSARVFDSFDSCRQIIKGHEHILSLQHFLNFPFQPEPYCSDCNAPPHAVPTSLIGKFITEKDADRISRAARRSAISSQWWKNIQIEILEDFAKLLARPWWRRVWVLQEAILAKKITLQCGPRSVDWPIFQASLFTFIRQGKRSRIHHIGGLTHESRMARAQSNLLNLAKWTFAFFMLKSSPFAQQARCMSTANLLSLTGHFEATDPRDKLFALVSLLPDKSHERLVFKPDYTANVKRLYIQIAKYFLETSQRLDVVTARPPLPDYYHPDLGTPHWEAEGPTWVPDWKLPQWWQLNSIWISSFSTLRSLSLYMQDYSGNHQAEPESADMESIIGEQFQVFNASLHAASPFRFEFSAYDEILNAHGVVVDTIVEVGQPWDLALAVLRNYDPVRHNDSRKKSHDAQVSIIEQWKTIAHIQDDGTYPFTTQPRHEAFWRTLFLDRYRSSGGNKRSLCVSRLPPHLEKEQIARIFSLGDIQCAFPPDNPDDEALLIWYLRHEVTEMWGFASVNLHCANLRFFRTMRGYIGICHPNARPRDKVAVLLGAPVPLVLREYAEGHLLVGQSYVHGIMDGEIIQAEIKQGRGRKKADFELFKII